MEFTLALEFTFSSQRNLSFTNCTFKDMPETNELYVMEGGVHGITTQESWDTIKDWSIIKK